jgi:hypothetical protein
MTTALNSLLAWLMQPIARSPWIQASAWAAIAFGIFQFLALPMVVVSSPSGWHLNAETAIDLGFTCACASLAFLRLPIALLALGMLGAWRLLALATFVVRILTGHATSADAPIAFTFLALTDICAVLWVIGAIATLRQKSKPTEPTLSRAATRAE